MIQSAGECVGWREDIALTWFFPFPPLFCSFGEYKVLMDRFQNFKHIYIVLLFFFLLRCSTLFIYLLYFEAESLCLALGDLELVM